MAFPQHNSLKRTAVGHSLRRKNMIEEGNFSSSKSFILMHISKLMASFVNLSCFINCIFFDPFTWSLFHIINFEGVGIANKLYARDVFALRTLADLVSLFRSLQLLNHCCGQMEVNVTPLTCTYVIPLILLPRAPINSKFTRLLFKLMVGNQVRRYPLTESAIFSDMFCRYKSNLLGPHRLLKHCQYD